MCTIRFFIKSTSTPATIHVRFRHGVPIDLSKSTQLFVNPIHWNKKTGRVRNTTEEPSQMFINTKLSELESAIRNTFLHDYTKGEIIDDGWILKVINNCYNREVINEDYKIYFMDFAEKWLAANKINRINVSTGRNVANGTMDAYSQTVKIMQEFDKCERTRTKFINMDLNWLAKWLKFMNDEKGYSYKTISNNLNVVKIIIREAKSEYNIKVNPQFESKKFAAPNDDEVLRKVIFDDEKLKVLFQLNVPQKLQKSLEFLIIGCWTGLRITDMMTRLNISKIENGFIELQNKKTRVWVTIPVHPMIQIIIQRNGGEIPKAICKSKFDKDIKTISELAGFNEETEGGIVMSTGKKTIKNKSIRRKVLGKYPFYKLTHAHTCRRTFSTLLCPKLPIEVVMAIGGWSSKEMAEHYNQKKRMSSAIQAADYFEKEYGYLLGIEKKQQ